MQPVTMLTALHKYADFNGRARRSEFWLFVLFELIAFFGIGIVGSILIGVTGGGNGNYAEQTGRWKAMFTVLFYCIVALGLLIPRLAVAVRRLHDSDKSGWLLLIAFIPFGGFVLLVFYCLDGTHGPNQFGPDPKAPAPTTAETFS